MKYDEAIATKLLDQLMEGRSLRQIAEDPAMPKPANVCRWASGANADVPEDFPARYAAARRVQADVRFDELIDTAKATPSDPASVNQARLVIDTMKWSLAKQYREKYGDHSSFEHSTPAGSPFQVKGETASVVGGLSEDALASIKAAVWGSVQGVESDEDVSERGVRKPRKNRQVGP